MPDTRLEAYGLEVESQLVFPSWKKRILATNGFWNNKSSSCISQTGKGSPIYHPEQCWWKPSHLSSLFPSHRKPRCSSQTYFSSHLRVLAHLLISRTPFLYNARWPVLTPATQTSCRLKAGRRESVGLRHARIFFLGLGERLRTFM